ncbi:flavoprotein [Paenibacillus sp. 11B]|uniref:Flavoprotein n=1 Tax=Paenibacillus vandeheii TaxID=3035917 RepID=A0ABT8JE05_9BACL|nr:MULTISPECIES: flavoprotein [Paenibacillus]MDN4602836.1 flavoprotein [Paenibacillus vandeheii]MDN8593514.1 flavoprotein [Paenibacillus sp. 11B]
MYKKKLLFGVTGSIGASNVPTYLAYLAQEYEINLIMTENSQKFLVSNACLPYVEYVYTNMNDHSRVKIPHANLPRDADLFLVLPATANFLFKIANGAADDLLTLAILNYGGPVCVAPNMNPLMWNSHSVQRNVKQLKEDGFHFLNVSAHSIEASSGNILFSEASLPQPQELIDSLNKVYTCAKNSELIL